jgi:arsenate reductase
MAEGWLRHLAGDRFEAHSAGSEATFVRPLAVRARAEVDVDISQQRSKSLDEYRGQRFDYVITVCDQAAEVCPRFPGAGIHLHWSLPDPAQGTGTEEERLEVFRGIRDRLRRLIQQRLEALSPP